MTVKELISRLNFKPIALPFGDKEITGAYVGDLLSWVMGRAEPSTAWITIMSNSNTVAVASLCELSCIILAEDVLPDGDTERLAGEKGVNIIVSPHSAYDTAVLLHSVLK